MATMLDIFEALICAEIGVRAGVNILLVGTHGIGKTKGLQDLARRLDKEVIAVSLSQYERSDFVYPAVVHRPDGSLELKFAKADILRAPERGALVFLDELLSVEEETRSAFLREASEHAGSFVAAGNPRKVGARFTPLTEAEQARWSLIFVKDDYRTLARVRGYVPVPEYSFSPALRTDAALYLLGRGNSALGGWEDPTWAEAGLIPATANTRAYEWCERVLKVDSGPLGRVVIEGLIGPAFADQLLNWATTWSPSPELITRGGPEGLAEVRALVEVAKRAASGDADALKTMEVIQSEALAREYNDPVFAVYYIVLVGAAPEMAAAVRAGMRQKMQSLTDAARVDWKKVQLIIRSRTDEIWENLPDKEGQTWREAWSDVDWAIDIVIGELSPRTDIVGDPWY